MRLIGAGDNVVDRYLDVGMQYPGGNALNVAVFAARAGVDAAYLGVVGGDAAGTVVLEALRSEGVDTDHVRVAPGANAWADVALHDGDRSFPASSRGVAFFEPDEDQFAAMSAADIVHSGYAGPLLPHVPRIAEASRVSFDFGSKQRPGDVEPVLRHLYLATFSAGREGPVAGMAMAEAVVASGARHAIVTLGADGAVIASARGSWHRPSVAHRVVDTLGAGDALIAVTLVGLLAGRDPVSALEEGGAAAAAVCTHHGAFGHGVPSQVAAPADGPDA